MSLFELLFDDGNDIPTNSREFQRLVAHNAKLRVDTVCAVSALAQENDRLRLYCAALARLLMKKGFISHEEISAMIESVDPEDGFVDAKLKGRPLPGERPRPNAKKPHGAISKPKAQPLPKPPKGWKPKGSV